MALSLAMGIPAFAQSNSSSTKQSAPSDKSRSDEITRERDNLPIPDLMDSIQKALSDKSSLQLSADQSRQITAANDAFQKQVTDFIRAHADGKCADAPLPSRADAEKRILDLLNKDQRTAAEKALRDTAGKRVTERHHEKHSDSHSDKKSGGDSHSNWPTSSSSQSSSESSSQRSSQSSRDSKSDHHSEAKSDKKSDNKRSSDKSSARNSATWSKLDSQQKQAAIHDLLQQLPAKDRDALAKELNLTPPR